MDIFGDPLGEAAVIVSVSVPSPSPPALVARTVMEWTPAGVALVHVTRPEELTDTPVGGDPGRLHDVGVLVADICTVPPTPATADAELADTVGVDAAAV